MTSQHRKARGMRTQLLVALRARRVWPYAESAGAGRPGPDVLNTIGVDIEVAARRGLPIGEKMKQLKARAVDGVLGVLVLRPDGMGEASIGDWPVVMRFDDWLQVMHDAGHGSNPAPSGVVIQPGWQDPSPRVLDGPALRRDCACGGDLAGLRHSPDACYGPECDCGAGDE